MIQTFPLFTPVVFVIRRQQSTTALRIAAKNDCSIFPILFSKNDIKQIYFFIYALFRYSLKSISIIFCNLISSRITHEQKNQGLA